MLKTLHIVNYALIDDLTIHFDKGLTVITGETGAGKSIIIGALGLILGQRAEIKSIKEGEEKSIVEAEFEIKNYNLHSFFKENDLDYNDLTVIRRELLANGKSRAFINDTPVSLSQLKSLSAYLLDIHSQHENILISSDNYQLNFVDAVAQNNLELEKYQAAYRQWIQSVNKLKKLQQDAASRTADQEYLQFQYNQLYEANLQQGEQAELEEEVEKMEHVEEIKRELLQADYLLSSGDVNALKLIKDTNSGLLRITSYLNESGDWTKRLESLLLELKDIASEIEKSESNTEFNPERLNVLQDRLSMIYSLQKKFKLDTIEELIELKDSLQERLNHIDNFDEYLKEIEKEVDTAKQEMQENAGILSQTRKKIAPETEKFLVQQLVALGIPDAQLQISIVKKEDFDETGADNVQLMFSANKNRSVQPIAQIASGGEISRVMLAIKSLLVHKSSLPTIIFDEIDTGVSGEVASRVGDIMKFMSETTQVITITHLPQIAAKGAHHFKVVKNSNTTDVNTTIFKLSSDERETEIAQLLSGKIVSDAALQNARELLKK